MDYNGLSLIWAVISLEKSRRSIFLNYSLKYISYITMHCMCLFQQEYRMWMRGVTLYLKNFLHFLFTKLLKEMAVNFSKWSLTRQLEE